MNANKAQQLEDEADSDFDLTIEGEWNRAMRALEAAKTALQTLTLLWLDDHARDDEKSDEAADLASVRTSH